MSANAKTSEWRNLAVHNCEPPHPPFSGQRFTIVNIPALSGQRFTIVNIPALSGQQFTIVNIPALSGQQFTIVNTNFVLPPKHIQLRLAQFFLFRLTPHPVWAIFGPTTGIINHEVNTMQQVIIKTFISPAKGWRRAELPAVPGNLRLVPDCQTYGRFTDGSTVETGTIRTRKGAFVGHWTKHSGRGVSRLTLEV